MTAATTDTTNGAGKGRVILHPRKARPFFFQHPWVFANAIARVEGDPQPGDPVALVTHEGQFIAWGLINPESQIRVRLYSWNEAEPINGELVARRIERALALRRPLSNFDDPASACRLVYSEADGLSGLIVDRYGPWLLLQWNSLALARHQADVVATLTRLLNPRGIWLRTEKGIRKAEGLEIEDGLVAGETPPPDLVIVENGIKYHVDLTEGQKTGFFLDQRDNRLAAARYAKGGRVLDVCCYSGGFSLNALVNGGAAEVLAVDVSEAAIQLAHANAELNGVDDRIMFIHDDAFQALDLLTENNERFDLIVLDPPKLARNRDAVEAALRGYHRMNETALKVLNPEGTLVTCSCSGLVSHEMFFEMLAQAAVRAGRHVQLLERRGPSADHPLSLTCPETDYLKCYICRVA